MENSAAINNDPNDWSNPPYLVCGARGCHTKWSTTLLGRDEANRLYREHTESDPCKRDIDEQIREYEERTRDRVWEFDQYVGVHRARELGLWKSDDDPNRTWTVTGTVSVTKGDYDDMVLTVEADGEKLSFRADRDQWGTWHTVQSGKGSRRKVLAQEDGRRSFLRALIAGLQHLEQAMDYRTKDPVERGTTNETG